MKIRVIVLLLMASSFFVNASDSLTVTQELTEAEIMVLYKQYADSIVSTLTYDTGLVNLKNDIAVIEVPGGFKYLNGKDSEMVLTDLWGNPPNQGGGDMSLGMLFPEAASPMSDSMFAINITYVEDGYIDDSDARDIDYDDLLETMQSDALEENKYRSEMGYEPIQIVGWASSPYYDAENKKLHWAKELKFGTSPINTLNYNIRILGRKGYLQLNAIGEMYVLDQVKENITPILSSVNFKQGNRYADFNPDIDEVAAYGIGGLIAGKVLAKAGIFAKLGLVLAKFWKIIAVAIIGFFAGIKKLFTGKNEDQARA